MGHLDTSVCQEHEADVGLRPDLLNSQASALPAYVGRTLASRKLPCLGYEDMNMRALSKRWLLAGFGGLDVPRALLRFD